MRVFTGNAIPALQLSALLGPVRVYRLSVSWTRRSNLNHRINIPAVYQERTQTPANSIRFFDVQPQTGPLLTVHLTDQMTHEITPLCRVSLNWGIVI